MERLILEIGDIAPRKGIIIQTRKGRGIRNEQSFDLPLIYRKEAERLRELWRLNFVRVPESGVYNCHGLTFGSRRSCITEEEDVQAILQDDDYTKIAESHARPGDIAIYLDSAGNLEHSAIIVGAEPADQRGGINKITVVSKWGRGPEFIHAIRNSPYCPDNIHFYRSR